MNRIKRGFLLAVFVVVGAAGISVARADELYHFIKEIPVGGEGGWDYLSIDPSAQRLYVSHGDRVVVIDLDADKIAGTIANTPGVHGVAIASDLGLGVTSNGRENKAGIVDLKTLKTLAKLKTAAGPDGMLYDPVQQEAWLFCGHADAATVINLKKTKVVATVPLGGRPEFAAVDVTSGRVFDNLEDKSLVAVIDAKKHKVLHRWPIAPGENASGMAIDVIHHRLFIGCHNEKMVMMDDKDGKVLATVPIGAGVDACAFDPGTRLAFASCGSGTTTIARENGDDLSVVQVLKTEPGARTMALDTTTHKIYLATARFEPQTERASGERRGRPRMIPGTFKVLVYGMEPSGK